MNKVRLKFVGSVALVLSTIGVLLAVGGQLNFLGNTRPDSVAISPKKEEQKSKPKYSFYDELKKRKTEVDQAKKNTNPSAAANNNTAQTEAEQQYRYVVQVGAFSKQSDATIIKKKVEKLGYSVRIVKGSRKFLVQTGPFVGKRKAFSIEKELKNKKFPTLVKRLK